MPLSSALNPIESLEYPEVLLASDTPLQLARECDVAEPLPLPGVPEEEVARRLRSVREEATAETETRLRAEVDQTKREMEERLARRLREFDGERTNYFKSIEAEVVHLALAIARKIIQREVDLDPALLAGLVRIALDRMQAGSAVRIRVEPAESERWTKFAANDSGEARWEVVADEQLKSGDCIVETELGTAHFGFEAQLRDVEESFSRLLAYRPEA